MQGGMRNASNMDGGRTVVKNSPQTLEVAFYREPSDDHNKNKSNKNGGRPRPSVLYIDHIGSELLHEIDGELKIRNALGGSVMLLQRPWKRQGLATTAVQATPVAAAVTMERDDTTIARREEDVAGKLVQLAQLKDAGILTQSEFDAKKVQLLERF
ncbi:MAG: hypothetical protein SGILL_009789 [Bacillariaceae sp.]